MGSSETLGQQLLALEEKLLQPETRRSASSVAALLTDDFVEIGSSGALMDRESVIEALRRESPSRRSIANFRAVPLAEGVVLVTCRETRHAEPGRSAVHSLRSSIWKLVDGRWRMAFHQGTIVK